ncbi:hypothetical protein GCM10009544_50050 [Streptomyces stramineus]|uniref:Uncharacterized protein n=1 Tax=Streptomyces stramineus TaxID=173861 RepID=A0ABN1AR62_9ACTN
MDKLPEPVRHGRELCLPGTPRHLRPDTPAGRLREVGERAGDGGYATDREGGKDGKDDEEGPW